MDATLRAGVHHRFLGDDATSAALRSKDGQIGTCLGVRGYRNQIGTLAAQNQFGIGVDTADAVALCEHGEAFLITIGGGDQLDLGAVGERLGIGVGQTAFPGVLMVVEAAVNVEFRCRPVHIIDIKSIRRARGQVVEHAHPPESDDNGPILWR